MTKPSPIAALLDFLCSPDMFQDLVSKRGLSHHLCMSLTYLEPSQLHPLHRSAALSVPIPAEILSRLGLHFPHQTKRYFLSCQTHRRRAIVHTVRWTGQHRKSLLAGYRACKRCSEQPKTEDHRYEYANQRQEQRGDPRTDPSH